jgi:PTH1 family peptidyl-tRNA hydrolase
MWLIVGLGNPGPEYEATRHNIGFLAVDALAQHYRASAFTKKFHGEIAEASIGDEKVFFLKPHTFMNLSGKSLQAAASFYKVPQQNIIVLHDELDLPLAKLRIKQGGGANGHNGIKDIDQLMGPDYWRVRLGIGHPGTADKVHDHVLSKFSKDERAIVDAWLENLARDFPLFWQHSPQGLMNKLSPPPERPKKDKTDEAAPAKASDESQ